MPYTKEVLEKKGPKELKSLLMLIQAHKSALTDEETGGKNPYSDKKIKATKEKLIKAANREKDLIFNFEGEYSDLTTPKKSDVKVLSVKEKERIQKNYLIDKIIEVQNSPFIGRYAPSAYAQDFDYVCDIDDIKATIDPKTGIVKYSSLKEYNKKSKEESKQPAEPIIKEPRDDDLDALINKQLDQLNKNNQQNQVCLTDQHLTH